MASRNGVVAAASSEFFVASRDLCRDPFFLSTTVPDREPIAKGVIRVVTIPERSRKPDVIQATDVGTLEGI